MPQANTRTIGNVLDNLTPAQFAMLRMADFEYWEEVKHLANEYQYPCERSSKCSN